MATENKFPTIRDLRDRLSELVTQGLGDHPVQVVIVPRTTMHAIASVVRGTCDEPANGRPPLMIELISGGSEGRLPATLVSADYLSNKIAINQ